MIISQFIFTLFCTVGFCLGLRIVTDKGQLLYFLRKPFDDMKDEIEVNENKIEIHKFAKQIKEMEMCELMNKMNRQLLYLFKPILLCVTCLASVWGVTWFILLNGISIDLIKFMVLNSFIAAFINTFIWNLYERL